jgi:hypothetical protein
MLALLALEGFALRRLSARAAQCEARQARCEAEIRGLGISAAEPGRLDAYIGALSEGLAPAPAAAADPVRRAALAMELELMLAGDGMAAKAARESSAQIVADPFAVGLVKTLAQMRGLSLTSVSAPARGVAGDCWMLDLSCVPASLGRALESFGDTGSGLALEGLDLRLAQDGRMMASLRVRTPLDREDRK